MKIKSISLLSILLLSSCLENKLYIKDFETLVLTASKKPITKSYYSKGGTRYTIEMRFKETPKYAYIIKSYNYKLSNSIELSSWLEIGDTIRVQIKKSDLNKIRSVQKGDLEYEESCIEVFGLYSKRINFLNLNKSINNQNNIRSETPYSFVIFISMIILFLFFNNYYENFKW